MKRGRLLRIFTIAFSLAVVACAVYIMSRGLGLSEQYDFGAGAYYYTDIPDYQEVVRDDLFSSRIPYWLHLLIFLAWGLAMYRLWVKIDKNS